MVAPGLQSPISRGESRGALLTRQTAVLISKVTQGVTTEIMGEGCDQCARQRPRPVAAETDDNSRTDQRSASAAAPTDFLADWLGVYAGSIKKASPNFGSFRRRDPRFACTRKGMAQGAEPVD